jgi:hypothetical protein
MLSPMRSRGEVRWLIWLLMMVLLALAAATPFFVSPTPTPYGDAATSVLTFVVSLLAMTAAVGSLAARESLVRGISSRAVDPQSTRDAARILRTLLGTWALCLVVGWLGTFLAWSAAKPALAWPYLIAAATLLMFHAPRAAVFGGTR